MISFSTEIAPLPGQDAGGRGSTNSGASRLRSEYSLIRSRATILCSSCTKRRTCYQLNFRAGHTTKSRSCETPLANAKANPAIAAVTPGAVRTITAVIPIMTDDKRLKRADSQRLTVQVQMKASIFVSASCIICRRAIVLAPNARYTATPDTVSPKSEYSGERVIESSRRISREV